MSLKVRQLSLGIVVATSAFVADYVSKMYMLEEMGLLQRPPIKVTEFFNLVAVWNPGISFGMFAGANMPLILSAVSGAIIIILLVWLSRSTDRWLSIALGLVIGGAAGNIIDRLRFGKVFDFLDFHVNNFHWPAFNVADSTIFIGVVLLCIHSMFIEPKLDQKKDEA